MSRYCITLNNYTDADIIAISELPETPFVYLIFSREVGEQGTPHLQGFMHLRRKTKWTTLVKRYKFLERAHFIESDGSDEDNEAYCSKDNDIVRVIGAPAHQGQRTDMAMIKDMMINQNLRVKEILPFINNYQQLKFAEGLQRYQKPKHIYKPLEVTWIYGKTGTGKTRYAIEACKDMDFWMSSKGLRWWDGYYGQPAVIIDEFRGDFCKFHELLRILDHYPYRVEVKSSSLFYDAEIIYITSCHKPEMVYPTLEDVTQLTRRLTHIIKITKSGRIIHKK